MLAGANCGRYRRKTKPPELVQNNDSPSIKCTVSSSTTSFPIDNRLLATLARAMSTSVCRAGVELSLLPSGKQIVGNLLRSLVDLGGDLLPGRSRLLV